MSPSGFNMHALQRNLVAQSPGSGCCDNARPSCRADAEHPRCSRRVPPDRTVIAIKFTSQARETHSPRSLVVVAAAQLASHRGHVTGGATSTAPSEQLIM